MLRKVKDLGVQTKFGTALDFGCGVGRLSRALSARFKKVIAVDISSSMINEARKANHHITNIEFIHNRYQDLAIISENHVDFLYSNIVLQHIPRNRQIKYIKEFCRVLSRGGLLAFQTPSKCNFKSWKGWLFFLLGNAIFNIARKVKYGRNGVMEVHALPKKIVLEILDQESMNVVNVERYDSAGPAFVSYMYYAGKS